MKATTDRILTAIFCDDIRHEMGNKISFMGCYQSELFVPAVPIVLPKLCVYATALTPIARPFKYLVFRVILDDQTELAKVEVTSEDLSNLSEIQEESATRKLISIALVFSPLFIDKPTSLRLMAETEEGEVVGPRLLIKVASVIAVEPKPSPKRMRKKKTVPSL